MGRKDAPRRVREHELLIKCLEDRRARLEDVRVEQALHELCRGPLLLGIPHQEGIVVEVGRRSAQRAEQDHEGKMQVLQPLCLFARGIQPA